MKKNNDTILGDFKFLIRNLRKDYKKKFDKYNKLALLIVIPATIVRNIYVILMGIIVIPVTHFVTWILPIEFQTIEDNDD